MGRYNPNYPTVLGNELAPVALDPVTIDTASAFGYTLPTEAAEIRTARVMMTAPPPGQPRRKVLTVEAYREQSAPSTGMVKRLLIPCTSGANAAGTSLVNGAASYQDAVNNSSDQKGVTFTGSNAAARFWFDTSTSNTKLHSILQNARILDISVRYAIYGQFNIYNQPIALSLERNLGGVYSQYLMDDALVGTLSVATGIVPRRSRLGDYNPFWNITVNPDIDMRRAPWAPRNDGANVNLGLEAFQAAGASRLSIYFKTIDNITNGVNAFTLHYCALEVTYASEGRLAGGAVELTNGVSIDSAGLFYVDVPTFSISSGSGFYWNQSAAQRAAVVVGQAVVGATSQTYPMPVAVDRLLPARDTFRGHKGIVFRKTIRPGEEWTAEEEPSLPAVALFTSTTTFDSTTILRTSSQVYLAQLANRVWSFSTGTAYAVIPDDVAGRVYTHIRVYARRVTGTTTGLRFALTNSSNVELGPDAVIQIPEFDALPEIVDGWREVTLELSSPVTGTGAGTFRWKMISGAASSFPWEVLGADAHPYLETTTPYDAATYGGTTAYARVNSTDDTSADMALMMIQALPVPTGLAVSPAVQALSVVDEECGLPVDAMPTGIRYHALSWTAVNDLSVGGFGYYEVQRRDTTMDSGVWETVAEMTEVTTVTFADYEARVGVESRYRIRTVHEDGYTSAWSSEVTGTVAAPGVTGTAVSASVLILTSNQDPDSNLAYVMAWDGSSTPEQSFEFLEADGNDFQLMYGRDYRVAFRPTERGGVQFTRLLMLNAVGVPDDTLDTAASPLRDLAWAQLPYVCVRDERHNRWLTSLTVPSEAVRDVPRRGHLVMASVTFTEVTATPAPVDYERDICEGILRNGEIGSDYWYASLPASFNGTRTLTDTFTRTVSNNWGSADTGQAWTSSGGAATDYQVAANVGTILTGSTGVDRKMINAQAFGNYVRTRMEMVVPAVATGASYTAGMIFRYVDASNYYTVRAVFKTTGSYSIEIAKTIAGVTTTTVTGTNINTYTVGTRVIIETYWQGTRILARSYRQGDTAPSWTDEVGATTLQANETQLAMGGKFAVVQARLASNTNTTLTISFDNITVDTLYAQLDLRMKVRPVADTWGAGYAMEPFDTSSNQEGAWALDLTSESLGFLTYGRDFSQLVSTKMQLLGLVRNRLTTVRLVVTQDNGAGVMTGQFYTLADDGVTWTLIDTINSPAPAQPLQPGPATTLLAVSAWQGQIWIEKWEVRLDGTLVASPDFDAQAVGTTSFTDGQGNLWETDGTGICDTL